MDDRHLDNRQIMKIYSSAMRQSLDLNDTCFNVDLWKI